MSYREVLFVDKLAKDAKLTLHKLLQNRRDTLWGETPVLFRVRKYKVAGEIRNERVTVVKPQLHKVKLYSTLLRKFIPLQLTPQMLRYVEACGGLDDYLLNTPDNKLKSNLASSLKVQLMNLKAELRTQSQALKLSESASVEGRPQTATQSETRAGQDMKSTDATSAQTPDASTTSGSHRQAASTAKQRKGKQNLNDVQLSQLKVARERYERERRDRIMQMLQAAAAAGGSTQIVAKTTA